MERVFGARIFDAPSHWAISKRDIARRLVHAVVSHSIFSAEDEALFHADPHAGNLMLARDGKLALLDWSLAGTLRAHVRAAIMQLLFSALTFDREKIREIVYGLDTAGRVDAAALERIIAFKLRGLGRGCLPGLTWLLGLFDDAVREAGLRLSPELVLFRKSLHSLDGVVSELATGDVRVDDVLIVDFLRQFIAEWPQRFFQSLNSRNLRTRISNADLAKLMLSLPIVFTRWLIESLNDLIIAKQPICLKFGAPAAADVP
jgi:ubiquinone biosynthesis protein